MASPAFTDQDKVNLPYLLLGLTGRGSSSWKGLDLIISTSLASKLSPKLGSSELMPSVTSNEVGCSLPGRFTVSDGQCNCPWHEGIKQLLLCNVICIWQEKERLCLNVALERLVHMQSGEEGYPGITCMIYSQSSLDEHLTSSLALERVGCMNIVLRCVLSLHAERFS